MGAPRRQPDETGELTAGRARDHAPQLLLPLSGGLWERVRDGDPRWSVLYQRHYSARRYRDPSRGGGKIVGPGEYLLLATATLDAIFAWRRFRSMDDQTGVGCCVFRNEGTTRSSLMLSLVSLQRGYQIRSALLDSK